jgi:hypothetical protein
MSIFPARRARARIYGFDTRRSYGMSAPNSICEDCP